MNINLKRKAPYNKPVIKKPRANIIGFNNGGNGSSSESETDEINFEKSIQTKSQKIAKQLSEDNGTDMDGIISEIEENDPKNIPKQHVSGLKYMNKLLDSKKQREKDRILSRQEYNRKIIDENADAIVFESENYKRQKEEYMKMKEEEQIEDEEPNNAQFYSKLLQFREKRSDKNDASQSITPNHEIKQEKERGLPERNRETERNNPTRKTGFKGNILNYKTNETSEKKQLLERLKELVKSNIMPDDISEYKKRYWNRYDN